MDLQIETQDVDLPPHSLESLRSRVQRAMGRVGDNVSRLHLSLRDENSSKGGRDKICVVRATLNTGGEILVVDRSRRLPRALFRGLRRSKVLVRRELKKRRQRARQRRTPAFA